MAGKQASLLNGNAASDAIGNDFRKGRSALLKILDGPTAAAAMPRILSPELADAFLRTMWRDIHANKAPYQTHDQGLLRRNAIEVHGRNYTPLLALHWGLTSLVAQRLKADTLPSFAWFRLYFQDDICRVHEDRAACEVSLSITLGLSEDINWDLGIGTLPITDLQTVSDDFGEEPYENFTMKPGDGVLYHGSLRRHGRIIPNPNRWSAHVFLQWVDRDGPNKAKALEGVDLGVLP
jgi:hypothetical protein